LLVLVPWIAAALATLAPLGAGAKGFESAASMSSARYVHSQALLPSGKVLVVGGETSVPLTSAELYDPNTNAWTAAGALTTARIGQTETVLTSGKVLVVGGYNAGAGGVLKTAQIYDPASNTWSPAHDLTTARVYHTATLLPSGKVLVVAGSS